MKSENDTKLKKSLLTSIRNPFLSKMFVFFIMLIVILALIFAFFVLLLNSERISYSLGIGRKRYTYQMGITNEEGTTRKTVSETWIIRDGVLYVSMTDIAKICELTVVGDYNSISYYSMSNNKVSGDSQYVTFYYGSDQVILNGVISTMRSKMISENNHIMIPASFFYDYVSGISVVFDDAKSRLEISRVSIGSKYNILGDSNLIYQDVSFMPSDPMILKNISERTAIAGLVRKDAYVMQYVTNTNIIIHDID